MKLRVKKQMLREATRATTFCYEYVGEDGYDRHWDDNSIAIDGKRAKVLWPIILSSNDAIRAFEDGPRFIAGRKYSFVVEYSSIGAPVAYAYRES